MNENPLFIKIDDFDQVSRAVDDIKERTEKIKAKLSELKEAKKQEDNTIKAWEQRIETLTDKVLKVEMSLSSNK